MLLGYEGNSNDLKLVGTGGELESVAVWQHLGALCVTVFCEVNVVAGVIIGCSVLLQPPLSLFAQREVLKNSRGN